MLVEVKKNLEGLPIIRTTIFVVYGCKLKEVMPFDVLDMEYSNNNPKPTLS